MMQTPLVENFSDYLRVGEAAEFLGVSTWTLRNWDKAGKLKPKRHPKNGYRIYRHEDLAAILEPVESTGRPQRQPSSPPVDWKEMGDSEHFVQFYENDEYLIDSVSGFIASALTAGDGGIIIATASHRKGIEQKLKAVGIDLASAMASGKFISLDAAETLSKFMVNDSPDPVRFVEVVGSLVKQLTAGGRRLRAFGEMVAILWADGNRAAAVRLEELWNELAKAHRFSLFCAYPLDRFSDEQDGEHFSAVCSCHSRVIPAESYATLPDSDKRHREISRLQQAAQSLEAEIAHRKEVELSLSRRERELSDFLENALEGLHQVGPDGKIIWANKAELDLLGYEANEYIGHHIAEFHVDRPVIDGMLKKLLSGQNLCDQPARLRCKDGSIRHVLIHSNAYFKDEQFIHSRCFTRDVTALKAAEQRQQELLESEHSARLEAERVSRMKDEFLATLSHELRTPLNAIFGWTQIIKETPAHLETVVEGITVIDRNVRAQTQLIEDLLDMSRIISGKIRLDVQQIELIPVLKAAAEAVRPSANAKGIQIRQILDPLAGPVSADPNRLQQVIWNLLTNAVKFTPPDGKIDLLLERVNSHLEITVSDSGQGISPEFLPHVFERFRQADSSISRKFGGLGIGLSIVKQLAELHGGNVYAKSAGEGRGASFIVTLPLMAAKTAKPAGRHTASDFDASIDCSMIDLTGVKVLVVDDELDARQMIARLLEDCRAEVVTAASVDEAIEIALLQKPQVLVSDIGMPDKDGYHLIREIRSQSQSEISRMPAVALTALARSEDRRRAMLAGFQLHLAKPLEPKELVVTVASLVGRAAR